ncbi:MAG: hypothetical protein R2862_02300 [Thermoanaerobaculia bacterium]
MFIFALALLAPGASVHGQSSLHQAVAPQRPGVAPRGGSFAGGAEDTASRGRQASSGIATLRLRAGKAATKPPGGHRISSFSAPSAGDRTEPSSRRRLRLPDPQKLLYSKLLSWQEAMAGMAEGEQRRFWFPAALTPKNTASGEQTPLVFDVELASGRCRTCRLRLAKPDPAATWSAWHLDPHHTGQGRPETARLQAEGALVELTV